MSRFFSLLAMVGVLCVPAVARAALITDGTLQNMPNPSGSGTPFWNNGGSFDGGNCNIGTVLTTVGSVSGCTSPTTGPVSGLGIPQNDLAFLGIGTNPAHFSFNSSSGLMNYLVEITGYAVNPSPSDKLYAYNVDDGTQGPVIFNAGLNNPGASTVLTGLPNNWGIQMITGAGNTFNSGAGSTTNNQFALFQQLSTGAYILGVEDLVVGKGDQDFNDMVISIQPMPEPGTLMLLGGGLAGLAGWFGLRRRQNRRPEGLAA